jgi:hypothetical protein
MPTAATKRYQNTTVRLPKNVYEQARSVIGRSPVSSFNEFVVQAIEEKVRRSTEAEIDAAFAQMAEDTEYQRDSVAMAREFETSDWKVVESAHAESDALGAVAPRQKTLNQKTPTHARTSKARSR